MIFDLVRWVRRQFRRPEGRTARRATRGPRLESLEDRTAPATLTWTGEGANANWSTRANWDLRAPRQGDSLVFPDGPAQDTANNNMFGLRLRSITFSGSGYTLTGGGVVLSQGIRQTGAASGDANNVNLSGILLTRTQIFTINGAADVKVSSSIYGIGGVMLVKAGAGTLSVEGGKAPLLGGIVVRAGELEVAPLTGGATGQSRIIVRGGGKLTGTGMASTVLVQSGGTLSPADDEVGALRTRNVTFSPNSTFRIDLDEAASPNLDQLSVRGRAVITNSTLAATGVYGSGIADSYTILDNDGRDRVVGRFAGLAQGATLRVPGPDDLDPLFTIDYFGGDGNDIVLKHVNSDPEADALSINATEGWSEEGQVTATDADGDALTYIAVTGPEHGSVVMNADGVFTYTPDDGYIGPDSFTFKANDGTAKSELETVSITVKPINEEPSFTAGPGQTALEDSGLHTVGGWVPEFSPGPAHESDQDLTFSVTNNNNALFSVQPAVSPDGTLTYTLAPDANGSATVSVTLSDDGGTANGGVDTSGPQTFTITVTPVNDAPSFAAGPDQTAAEDSGPHIEMGWATAVSAGPNEGAQAVTFTVTNDNNALFSVQPAVSPDGTLVYTLAPNANGSATVSVTLSDGDSTSDPQTFTITVTPADDAPSFAVGPDQTALEDAPAQTVHDFATAITADQDPTFSVSNDNNALFSAQPAVSPDGTLTYTLAPNANGAATVIVTLSDDGGTANGGDTSGPQTFTIIVTPVNDAPSFAAGPDQTAAEDSGPHIEMGWATAVSAGPADESGQTLTFTVTNDNNALFSVQPAVSPDGTLVYTLAPNANGSATVSVTLSDGDSTSDPQTFTITVTPADDAPTVSVPSTQTATANQNLTFSTGSGNAITVADADGDTLTVTIAVMPHQGNVKLTLFQTTGLTGVTGNGTASVSFTGSVANINAALNGLTFNDDTAETGLTFTITVNDGTALVVSDSFTINVNS